MRVHLGTEHCPHPLPSLVPIPPRAGVPHECKVLARRAVVGRARLERLELQQARIAAAARGRRPTSPNLQILRTHPQSTRVIGPLLRVKGRGPQGRNKARIRPFERRRPPQPQVGRTRHPRRGKRPVPVGTQEVPRGRHGALKAPHPSPPIQAHPLPRAHPAQPPVRCGRLAHQRVRRRPPPPRGRVLCQVYPVRGPYYRPVGAVVRPQARVPARIKRFPIGGGGRLPPLIRQIPRVLLHLPLPDLGPCPCLPPRLPQE